MRRIISVLLYAALVALANPASADIATAIALREGDMKKLRFHDAPRPVSQAVFRDLEGASYRFSDYRGKVVLVNFWATWCAPCRKEMPTLEALQAELGGEDFEVLTIATKTPNTASIPRFFAEAGVSELPSLIDPGNVLSREMAVFGLPLTVLLDREGREIARLVGDADWASQNAFAVLRAVIDDGS